MQQVMGLNPVLIKLCSLCYNFPEFWAGIDKFGKVNTFTFDKHKTISLALALYE